MIRELSKLMNEHIRYPLFGMLLFTEAHPHIVKMLKDVDYYSALDKISGSNLAFFITMLFRGEYVHPIPPPDILTKMVPVWKEPKQNMKVLPWFDIKDSRVLPLLVIFCHENRKIYFQKHLIKAKSPEEAFNDLNDVLLRISASVQKASDADGINKDVLFRYAQWEIRKLDATQKIINLFEAASTIRGAVGI